MPIEKCTALMDGVECGLPVEEESPDAVGLLRVFRCSWGHRSYSMFEKPAGIPADRIGFDVIEFRTKSSEQTWHLSPSCSLWPTENFISSTSLSHTDTICNECIVTSSKKE